MRLLKWTFVAAAVALGVAGLVLVVLPSPVSVETRTVARGAFVQTIDEDGKTRVRDKYVVSAPLAGRLERIALHAGDRVGADAVVAIITPLVPQLLDVRARRELQGREGAAQADLTRARATVLRAEAAFRLARSEHDRQQRLVAGQATTAQEAEQAQVGMESARQDLEAARSEEHAARHELEAVRAQLSTGADGGSAPWQVQAPVSGEVLRVVRENAGFVAPGEPLLELGDPNDMEIVVDVLSADAIQIAPGADVSISQWGGDHPLTGRVRRIEPSARTKLSALGVEEQRVDVLVDITSPPEQWKNLGDGFRVETAIVVFRSADVIKVPASALFREEESWAVYVVSEGRAHRRIIRSSRRNTTEAVVDDGLAPGDVVVNYPTDAIREGGRVQPQRVSFPGPGAARGDVNASLS